MEHFNVFTQEDCNAYKTTRYNLDERLPVGLEEEPHSFKDHLEICNSWNELQEIKAPYVIIGIPEDLGIRANMGRPGAHEAWDNFLTHFLNLQHSELNDAHRFCILGTVQVGDLITSCVQCDVTIHEQRVLLSDAIKVLDDRVTAVVDAIIKAKKIPIIIGGGHNNCFPILRSLGKESPIDCINMDAHTDLRPAKGRHSGNGFTHAIEQGFLKKYFMIGIQHAYLTNDMIKLINDSDDISYVPYTVGAFDDAEHINRALSHVDSTNYGLEIDMDVVAQFPSSAQSPVGYSLEQLRSLVKNLLKESTPKYIHICEAAPRYGTTHEVGKALANLVNDFK